MVVKLHRCSGMWMKFRGHACWRVQKALDESGIEYDVIKDGSAFKGSVRGQTIEKTGQMLFPWIEFEDGTVYREQSKDMAATIQSGRLDEKRQDLGRGPTSLSEP